jgi:radical SAM protein with 4Fe4S-binding SPASM domain
MTVVVDPLRRTREVLGRFPAAGLGWPKKMTIMITNDCNLHCRHCWPESLQTAGIAQVPATAIMKRIQLLARLGVEELSLTGGEPLTHPEWLVILAFACRQPGLKRIYVQTNATLLNEVDVKYLRELPDAKLRLQVSLEGAATKTHDYVRGPGNFARTWQGLKLLVESGLGSQTIVTFTEMEHNFSELPFLLKMLELLGIAGLVSATLVSAGRAGKTEQIAPPSPDQYRELLSLFHNDAEFRTRYRKIGNIAALEWYVGRMNPASRDCLCGEAPYINAKGHMFPCFMLPIEKYGVQGMYDRPLEEVFAEAASRWAELVVWQRRRTKELEECKGCSGRLHCAGGCMGRAYVASGDFMAVEDRCILRETVYLWHAPAAVAAFPAQNASYEGKG